MCKINFEPITEKDLPDILNIFNYYIENSTAIFYINPLNVDKMRELTVYENENRGIYKTFIIKCGGVICGYVTVKPHSVREAYALTADLTIILHPDFTGKGIGGKALDFIENYAREKGLHVLIAGIESQNIRSIKLFEKRGFIKCAHYREVGQKFGKILDVVDYQKILENT